MSIYTFIPVIFIVLYLGYWFYMKNKNSKQAQVVNNTDFKAEFANAEQYKNLTEAERKEQREYYKKRMDDLRNSKNQELAAMQQRSKERIKSLRENQQKREDKRQIIKERKNGGPFSNLKDFIERLSGKEVNKRTIESFIKSGAFDSLGGTRKQFMVVYVQILDQVNRERKYSMTGQLSLFDIVSDDQKSEFDIPLPDVGEYEKETKLAFEKEVLGVYLSGHPLEDYEEKWRKNISRTTLDFQLDDETGRTKVHDGAKEIVGGMITNKTIKYTKTNKVMAFITLEDLVGSVEVVIFPRDFEKNQMYLNEEAKVFIKGRVSEEDDAPSKLICEQVIPFAQTRKELWLQYPDKETYLQQEGMLQDILKVSEGMDEVIIYCKKEKAVKRLPKGWNVTADEVLLSRLTNYLGESCVKVIEKPIESVH